VAISVEEASNVESQGALNQRVIPNQLTDGVCFGHDYRIRILSVDYIVV
jgi:hypothetical protein